MGGFDPRVMSRKSDTVDDLSMTNDREHQSSLPSPRVQTLAAAILAGGQATRLGGVNKGTLSLGNAAIVDRQLEALRAVASTVFVVGPDSSAWSARGLTVVPDEVPGMGALGGIYTAILHSPCDRTLVVACDMPFLSVEVLARMAAIEDADLVIPTSARGHEPLCAIYTRACLPDIRARIARGALQARTLPQGVRIAELGPDMLGMDERLFVNVNTPHDYERAKGLIELKPVPTEDRITTDAPDVTATSPATDS
jgi:molybdopterin-guanine dinucleotide biosynthesis protein A